MAAPRRTVVCMLLMAALIGGAPARAQQTGPSSASTSGRSSGAGPSAEGPGGQTGGSGARAEELPAPLDELFEALDPGRFQHKLDEFLGLDAEQSSKPKAPELPLAVFVESIRPLGALKYENQLNYFVSTFTGSAPTFQSLTYEYVFADWNALRVEVIAPRPGRIDALGLGYQRTLGVGRDHNWAHGVLLLPEFSLRGTGFVGGSTFYTFGWKPDEKSPWTASFSIGANRASFANRPLSGASAGGSGMPGADGARSDRGDETRAWRPLATGNAWYTVSSRLTVGLELVAYPHGRFGEYLAQPNFTWRPTKHFFVQAGAGWYEVGGRDQASFMCRINLLNPSSRQPREDH